MIPCSLVDVKSDCKVGAVIFDLRSAMCEWISVLTISGSGSGGGCVDSRRGEW